MAWGWSPVGRKSATSLKSGMGAQDSAARPIRTDVLGDETTRDATELPVIPYSPQGPPPNVHIDVGPRGYTAPPAPAEHWSQISPTTSEVVRVAMPEVSSRVRFGRRRMASPRTASSPGDRSRAQSLVEFALVLPVMLLLVAGGLDVGRMFFSWIEVNNSAREAAAYAGGNPTDTPGITAHASLELSSQRQAGEGAISVTASCADPTRAPLDCALAAGGNDTGNTVTVRVARTFSFLTPMVGTILGGGVTMSASATSVVYGMQPNEGGSAPDPCDPPTLAAFTVTPTNLSVAVDASTSTPNSGRCAIETYDWDWGDGSTPFPPPIGKQTTWTYGTGNTYTIQLTVSNPGGSLSTTRNVTVPPPGPSPTPTPTPAPTPSPTPSPSPTNPCSMTPTFTYTEQGQSGKFNFFGAYTGQPAPASWFWWYGDGDVGFGQAPSQHRYDGDGPYTVTLLVTNGSCQGTVSDQVSP